MPVGKMTLKQLEDRINSLEAILDSGEKLGEEEEKYIIEELDELEEIREIRARC